MKEKYASLQKDELLFFLSPYEIAEEENANAESGDGGTG